MAEDLLPLIGFRMDGRNSSDSEGGEEEEEAMEGEEQEAVEPPEEQAAVSGNPEPKKEKKKKKDKDKKKPKFTYDKSLPGAHSYLGSDLEEVRGRTVHEDDSFQNIPLLSLPGVVLAPGQVLPLHLFQPSMISMIRRVVDKDKTFGVFILRFNGQDYNPTSDTIGTTAEILAIKEEMDDNTGISTMRVKAIGRQRFAVESSRRQVDGIIVAKVRILPEKILPDPLEGAHLQSHRKLFAYEHEVIKPKAAELSASGDHKAVLEQYFKNNKRKKVSRLSSAVYTWWPPWVYKQYDTHYIMGQVRAELQSWNETLKEEVVPKDPVEFSHWLAGNLPLDDGMKLHLLRIDSAVQRLRCELTIMQKCTVLRCKLCGENIANKKDVFSMALEGLLAAYVNPGGHVHETLTVSKAQGLHLQGRSCTEHSWFPGYAWTIAECAHCNSHMGWKFTATKRKMRPEKFWGLCRSSLQPGLQSDDGNTEAWRPIM